MYGPYMYGATVILRDVGGVTHNVWVVQPRGRPLRYADARPRLRSIAGFARAFFAVPRALVDVLAIPFTGLVAFEVKNFGGLENAYKLHIKTLFI